MGEMKRLWELANHDRSWFERLSDWWFLNKHWFLMCKQVTDRGK